MIPNIFEYPSGVGLSAVVKDFKEDLTGGGADQKEFDQL